MKPRGDKRTTMTSAAQVAILPMQSISTETPTVKNLTIYHNPRCSKSRATLALLREHGATPRVVEYLDETPTADELKALVAQLGIRPEQLVRKGEDIYKTKYAGASLTDDEWIAALVENPILIERPIVTTGRRAVIGRPPENVLELLTR